MSCNLLCFDTSTPRMLIALGNANDDEPARTHVVESQAGQASALLIPGIETLLTAAGTRRDAITHLACGTGPGTFTGSRVAVSTAMGLATGLGLRVHAVSTLAALAASVGVDGTVWALLDARRGDVYGAPVACTSRRADLLDEPTCGPLSEFVARHRDRHAPRSIVGTPVSLYADAFDDELTALARPDPGLVIDARGLWRAANAAVMSHDPVDPAALRATYLRESYAEMGLNRPKRPMTKSPFV